MTQDVLHIILIIASGLLGWLVADVEYKRADREQQRCCSSHKQMRDQESRFPASLMSERCAHEQITGC